MCTNSEEIKDIFVISTFKVNYLVPLVFFLTVYLLVPKMGRASLAKVG